MDSSNWTGFTTSLFTPHSLKRLQQAKPINGLGRNP